MSPIDRIFEAPKQRPDVSPQELRAARLDVARRAGWQEVRETQLVKRARWLVDSESDELLTIRGGTTFVSGKASLLSGDGLDLLFYIDAAGDIVVLEKVGMTWSQAYARLSRRSAPA